VTRHHLYVGAWPEGCSGFAVGRHDETSLTTPLGSGFELIGPSQNEQITPVGTTHRFQFSTFGRQRD